MDPVSAIGLASAILTFIDFSWGLVGGAVEIYRSVDGKLKENAHLDDIRDDFDHFSDVLGAKPLGKTRAEKRIGRIAEDCRNDSKRLEALILEVSDPGNKRTFWQSLRTSLANINHGKEISELKNRLQNYRSEVLNYTAEMLKEGQSNISLQIAKLREDSSNLNINFRMQIATTRDEVLGALRNLSASVAHDNSGTSTSLKDISDRLCKLQSTIDNTMLQHRLLRQLIYDGMEYRASQIERSAEGTYSWVLEDGPPARWDQRKKAWNTFLEWLRAGKNIFYVSGNPGSGKSVLMKSLGEHDRTKEELLTWAGDKTLIFCRFYFWDSGSKAQRSLQGLYRSLLYQALSQCPELMKEVFPAQLKKMQESPGDKSVEKVEGFGDDHIKEAFKLLLGRASPERHRLCWFIDGLDESEGNQLRHEELAKAIQDWSRSDTIKLCVSSRPYPEFDGVLDVPGNQLIRLHELNSADIRTYCLNTLAADADAKKKEVLSLELVETVVKDSQGVFLWVHLVVDILIMGFRRDDSDSDLLAQLHELPKELDRLYDKIREPLKSSKIRWDKSNRFLLLAARHCFTRDLTAMAFSWLEVQDHHWSLMDPEFPPTSELSPYSEKEISVRLNHVKKQINDLARGFLEVYKGKDSTEYGCIKEFFEHKVRFCHRTVRDYLLDTKSQIHALDESWPGFEASRVYGKVHFAETTHGWSLKLQPRFRMFKDFRPASRKNIEPDIVDKFKPLIQKYLRPQWISLHSYLEATYEPDGPSPNQIYFLAYAAECGLNKFVMRELDRRRVLILQQDGILILTAIACRNHGLIVPLLTVGWQQEVPCLIYTKADTNSMLKAFPPAIAVAVVLLSSAYVNYSPVLGGYPSAGFHDTLALKLGLAMLKSWNMSVRLTIGCWRDLKGDKSTMPTENQECKESWKELNVRLDAQHVEVFADIVFGQGINFAEDRISPPMVLYQHTDKEILNEEWEGTLEWLANEVRDQRNDYRWTIVGVLKSEWFSEERGMVDLTQGFIRMY